MLRTLSPERFSLGRPEFDIPDLGIVSVRVPSEGEAAGKTLRELGLRQRFGLTVLAIRRGPEVMANPDGDVTLLEGDILVLMGKHENLEKCGCVIHGDNQ
jgi:CPA2 family monovalent cation:H+ antiporter-2